jgi:hypothetical protein
VVHKLWQAEELAVVYRAINGVVCENGLDAFCLRFSRGFVRTLTVRTNAVRGLARSVDGLHSLLRRKKGPIFDLLGRAKAMKARVDGGEDVPDDERYPEEAIPIPAGTDGQEDGEAEDGANGGGESGGTGHDESETQDDEDVSGGEEDDAGAGEEDEDHFVQDAMRRCMTDAVNIADYPLTEAALRSQFRKRKRDEPRKVSRSKRHHTTKAEAMARDPVAADEDQDDTEEE